jgi:ABC-type taurine transport system ATPase subunit
MLTQLAEGFAVSYTWNFGDDVTSIDPSPTHTYETTGDFTVNLKTTITSVDCPAKQIITSKIISIEDGLCGTIFCVGGGVGIGTQQIAAGYKLFVQGKIITDGARLDASSRWPDYVFQKNYNLMPLPELKKYINQNRHLPGVPSAHTVKQDGIDIGQMSETLLQKTEELTLYLLNLEARLKRLELDKDARK